MMSPEEFDREKALQALFDALLGRDKKKEDDKKEKPSPKKPGGPVIGFKDPHTGKWTDLSNFGEFYRF